jgi:hypothetical protein
MDYLQYEGRQLDMSDVNKVLSIPAHYQVQVHYNDDVLLWVDTETSGLSSRAQVLEVAYQFTDEFCNPISYRHPATITRFVDPEFISTSDITDEVRSALHINKIADRAANYSRSEEDYKQLNYRSSSSDLFHLFREFPSPSDVGAEIMSIVNSIAGKSRLIAINHITKKAIVSKSRVTLSGWNTQFDKDMLLRKILTEQDMSKLNYSILDVGTIYKFLAFAFCGSSAHRQSSKLDSIPFGTQRTLQPSYLAHSAKGDIEKTISLYSMMLAETADLQKGFRYSALAKMVQKNDPFTWLNKF